MAHHGTWLTSSFIDDDDRSNFKVVVPEFMFDNAFCLFRFWFRSNDSDKEIPVVIAESERIHESRNSKCRHLQP